MKLNRKLVLLLTLVLSLALATGGTLAYLSDTDADVNTMTLGNVHIEQIEQERDENGDLTSFTQGQPAYPAVGEIVWDDEGVNVNGTEYQVFDENLRNVIDKIVTVKNTGKSPAYVRTIIAIEAPDGDPKDLIHVNFNPDGLTRTPWTPIEIDGVDYVLSVFTYTEPLLPGEISAPSLMQVFLGSEATNEDVSLFGDTWEIFVVSQAIQTAGFESAEEALQTGFGPVSAQSHPWMDGEEGDQQPDELPRPGAIHDYNDVVNYSNELYFAPADAKTGNYYLACDQTAQDIYLFGPGVDVSVDLNNKTLTAGNPGQFVFGAINASTLRLHGNGQINAGKGFMASGTDARIVFDGGSYHTTVTQKLSNMLCTSLAQNGSFIVINDGVFTTDVDNAALFFATSNAIIEVNGGFFQNTADATPDLFNLGTNNRNTNRIIFKGGTFVNWNPLEDRMCYTGAWPDSYEQFSGPWMLVWDGYTVVSETQDNGDVWYTVVKK